MKAKPLDTGSVLRRNDEKLFYEEFEHYAQERELPKILEEDIKGLLMEYLEVSAYQYVKLPDLSKEIQKEKESFKFRDIPR